MSNRAQRRAEKKIKRPAYRGLTPEQKKEQLFKNGITADDLDKAYNQGVTDGYKAAAKVPIKICYAATALTLKRSLGFGIKRIKHFMTEMDNTVTEQFSSSEAVEKVWEETGLKLTFHETDDTIIQDT